ncbi:MAG: cupin domain-containing protein [Planctomycetes bacterium]|nr:cupin domain-containing protein [Planctomycetota bacterium]
MAVVTALDTKLQTTDPRAIARLLAPVGIAFEHWGVERLPAHLRGRNLSTEEKQQVLEAYKPELDRMKSQGGYVTADVISLWPDTPNIEALCCKFDKKHIHTEDEVRFVVQGRGVFRVFPDTGAALDIELHPGDYISVPARYKHLFFLCADKQITCIRLFVDAGGWVAHYADEGLEQARAAGLVAK